MKNFTIKINTEQFNGSIRKWTASLASAAAIFRKSLLELTAAADVRPAPCGNILGLLDHLCDHDEAMRVWFLRWLAYQLRTPAAHMSTAVVLNGGHNSGKSLFLRYVVAQLFHNEVPLIQARQLQNVFNDWASDGGLVVVDGRFSETDAMWMKRYMTAPEIDIHSKGRESRTIPNTLNFVYLSQADDFSTPMGSRRFTVIDVPPARNKEFYHAILHEIACGGVESFRNYLLHELDMGSFNSSTPAPAPKVSSIQEVA